MKISVLFNNINQMMIYYGRQNQPSKKIQGAPDVDKHITSFKQVDDISIAGFAEVLFDDKDGNSRMLQELSHALGMPYIRYEINGPCFENVPEIQGKYYGQAILSKHPIENYKAIEINDPDIVDPSTFSDQTIDEGAEPHRKFVQKALINHDGALINFVNLHSIPFHLFTKNGSPLSINDPDLDKWRQRLNDIIRPNNNSPVILAGDFNNTDCSIKELLPDLFEGNSLSNCIDFSSTPASVVFDRAKEQTSNQLVNTSVQSYQDTQVDYLLSSPSLRISNKKVLVTPSDHPALFAQFVI